MAGKIIAFGEVMMRFSTPNHLKLQQTESLDVSYTGTGVNVLSALSRYDNNVALVTRLPENSLGDAAVSYLGSLGISSELISRGGDYLGMYFLETGFDVRPTKVTYSNRKESSFCTSQLDDYDFDAIFQDTAIIHFCGITLAISEQTRQLALAVAEKAVENNVKVAFDCNYRPKLWNNDYETARMYYEQMLSFADICFMTERDAEHLLGMQTKKSEQKDKIADLLPLVAEKYQIDIISGTIRHNSVTEGNKIQGFVCHKGQINYSQEHSFKILDRIGGGDGFASGIIHGFAHDMSVEEMVEFATAAGVLAHTTNGDAPISSMEDISAFIRGGQAEIER